MIDNDKNITPLVGRLNSMVSVRKELVRLYREARSGEVPIPDASKLANMLQIIGNVIKDSTIEQLTERLDELERRA